MRLVSSPLWLGHALLFVALATLRLQIASDLGFDFGEALGLGLGFGWLYDAAAVCTVMAVPTLAQSNTAQRVLWLSLPLAFILWLVSTANALHFRWFGVRLDYWVVRLHWDDYKVVGGSAKDLGMTVWFATSLVMFLAACAAYVLARPTARQGFVELAALGRRRVWLQRVAPALALAALALIGWRLPEWTFAKRTSMVLSDQILRVWWYETTHGRSAPGRTDMWLGSLPKDADPAELDRATATLADYRDHLYDSLEVGASPSAPSPAAPTEAAAYPLLRTLAPDPNQTRALRARLGLPAEGPLHVMMLFVESLRAYELMHPELGPKVMPRLRQLLDQRSIYFTQAYSSARTAGQTVRGQFSTLCSALPNVLGAATYIAHTATRLRCLGDVFAQAGYETVWMNPYKSTYHSKRQFELLHGMREFLDEDFWVSQGVSQRIGWGLADAPTFARLAELLPELAGRGKPLFGNFLTLSTHHPHTVIPEGPLPADLMSAEGATPDYLGYLSRLRYADDVVTDFVTSVLAGPLGANTLIVLLGDHSVPQRPHFPMNDVQRMELLYRIPIALITKALPSPERISTPTHQIDIAPTVAQITGVSGEVTWLGSSLLAERPTAWVYEGGSEFGYRTTTRGCYGVPFPTIACFDTRGRDPLFDAELPALAEVPAQTEFMRRVLRADLYATLLNRIAPAAR